MIRAAAVLLMLAAAGWLRAADPLEGRWRMSDGGPELSIEADAGGTLRLVWVDGADPSILPGTVVGTAVPTALAGTYDCEAQSDPRGRRGRRQGRVRFVLRLDAEHHDTFTVEPYERKTTLRLWALLPRWWGHAVKKVDTRPAGLDGARRIDAPPQYIEL